MAVAQRRKAREEAPNSGMRISTKITSYPPSSASNQSLWQTITYILHQILELLATVILLGYGLLLPAAKDIIASIRMGKSFNPATDIASLDGKVILVTGGNTGLGKQTIQYLSSHGPARIYLAARTASKAEAAIQDIKSAVPNASEVIHLPLDLSSFSSVASAAETFLARESRLDILINNAGIMASPYSLTKEGYEIQFGTNHMGPALLTKLLLPTLRETARQGNDVRVIWLSSTAHQLTGSEGIIFDQAALEKQNTWYRYGASKLAPILYARSYAEQYPEFTSVSIHPGVILTDLWANMRTNVALKAALWVYSYIGRILPGHYKSAEGGALNQTWAATVKKEELANGAYYTPVGVKNGGSKLAKDAALQKKLWEYTERELEKHGY